MSTLPLYWNLSSAVKEERINASVKLVGALQEFQSQYTPAPVPNGNARDSDAEDDDSPANIINGIDALNAEDVRYAIRRLGRGLASPRESSRLGFAVALTELLSRLDTVSSSHIISLVLNSTETSGSMQGHEVRDQYFARLFGLTSVIQSSLLFRNALLPASASSRTNTSTLADFQTVVNELVALGNKKTWLRESCWWAITLAAEGLSISTVLWKNEAAIWLGDRIFIEDTTWTVDKLAFALKLEPKNPSLPWEKYLSPTFKEGQILATTNLTTVSKLLRDLPLEDSTKASGSWKPQLHHSWETILKRYYPTDGSPSTPKSTFQEFYRIAVDESLFSINASPERKSWGFSVFEQALSIVPPEQLPLLFTKNFMRTWINQLSGKDRTLHKAAQQVASAVQAVANKHPATGFTLIVQLLGPHGSHQFDKITRTRTVSNIITSTDLEGVQKFVDYVRTQVDNQESDSAEGDSKAIDAKRTWAIDIFSSLISNGAVPRADSWILSILEFFAVHGFFTIGKKNPKSPFVTLRSKPASTFSTSLQKSCREQFFQSIAHLIKATVVSEGLEGKATRRVGTAADGELWLTKALNLVQSLEADAKHISPIEPVDEELKTLRAKAIEMRKSLAGVEATRENTAKGCDALLASYLLQTYDIDGDVSEGLEESIASVGRLLAPPKAKANKKKRKSKSLADDEDKPIDDSEQPPPIDEIIDKLIGFLEAGTAYAKAVAGLVFGLVVNEVERSGVDLILAQLEQRDVTKADDEEDENEDEDDDDGDLEMGSTIDVDSSVDDSDDKDDDEDAEEDSEAGSDDDDDANMEVDEELRRKIAEALRVSTDPDVDEEEDEALDDEEMLKMDEQLAQVFRMQQGPKVSRKKQTQSLQREATHFKIRVLDLLEIYMAKHTSSEMIIPIVLPLVESLRGARVDETQFATKASALVSSRLRSIKEVSPNTDLEGARNSLASLSSLAQKAPTAPLLATICNAVLFVARTLFLLHDEDFVLDTLNTTIDDFLLRKASRLNVKFFEEWVRRLPATFWAARHHIVDLCTPEVGTSEKKTIVNSFRKAQVLTLLTNSFPPITKSNSEETQNQVAKDIISFIPSYRQLLYAIATESATAPAPSSSEKNKSDAHLNPAELGDLFLLQKKVVRSTQAAVRRLQQTSSKDVDESQVAKETIRLWDADALSKVAGAVESSERIKGNVKVIKAVSGLLAGVNQKAPGSGKKQKKEQEKEKKGKVDDQNVASPGAEAMEVDQAPSAGKADKKQKKRKAKDAGEVDTVETETVGSEQPVRKVKRKKTSL